MAKQFEKYVVDATNKNVSEYSEVEIETLKTKYRQAFYPGSHILPENFVNILASPDPDKTLNSKLITDPKSICINSPFTCDSPWFSPLSSDAHSQLWGSNYSLNCVVNLDQGKAIEKKCEKIGGQNMFFDPFDFGGGKAVTSVRILLLKGT